MFGKDKVSQSMIDAVKQVVEASAPIKEPTSTGVKVYGRSYGNSAKAKQDQTKSAVDTLKGPKDKEMSEELKGGQEKIDAQDFKILQGKKKVKEGMEFAEKLLASIQEKKDVVMPEDAVPAKNTDIADKSYLKDMGKKPTVKSDLKNLGRFLTGKKETNEEAELTEEELDVQINEVLSKDASAGDWIHDFVHSDNPKFAGKSKAERKKMALGAYYGKQNEESEVTTDTLAGRSDDGKDNDFKKYKVKLKGDVEAKVPAAKEAEKTTARTSIKTEETIEEGGFKRQATDAEEDALEKDGWKKTPANVTDKSGAKHTPMSRAKDLARSAFKKIKSETMMGKISN